MTFVVGKAGDDTYCVSNGSYTDITKNQQQIGQVGTFCSQFENQIRVWWTTQHLVINEREYKSLYDWCQLVYHHDRESRKDGTEKTEDGNIKRPCMMDRTGGTLVSTINLPLKDCKEELGGGGGEGGKNPKF